MYRLSFVLAITISIMFLAHRPCARADESCNRADVNTDGLVDPLDGGFVLSRLGCTVGAGDSECDLADANADGTVDPLDSGFVMSRFNCSVAIDCGLAGPTIFQHQIVSPDDDTTYSATPGDFNNDGHLDLATAGGSWYGPKAVNIQLNHGCGTFYLNSTIDIDARSIASADFDLDGYLDLVVKDTDTDGISILWNIDGAIIDKWDLALGVRSSFANVTTADMNGDLAPDILVAWYDGVVIVFNDGTGGFEETKSIESEGLVNSVQGIDLNGDGWMDLLAAEANPDGLSVRFGIGGGDFGAPSFIELGGDSYKMDAGDLDNDNDIDVAVTFSNYWLFAILFNQGGGNFESAHYYFPLAGVEDIALADLDLDGDLDLVTADGFYDVLVAYHNDGSGALGKGTSYGTSGGDTVLAADWNGDSYPDVVTAGNYSHEGSPLSLMVNAHDGTFDGTLYFEVAYFAHPDAVTQADFDLDGDLDIGHAGDYGVGVALNDGSSVFTDGWAGNSQWASTEFVATGDLNKDGYPDIVSDGAAVFVNQGNATFEQASIPDFDHDGVVNGAMADIDQDGDDDVIILKWYEPGLMLISNGDGTFAETVRDLDEGEYSTLGAADFDGDGDLDLAVANWEGSKVTILVNDGFGYFETLQTTEAGTGIWDLVVEDLDDDGDKDIATANFLSNDCTVLINDGTAGFTKIGTYPIGWESDHIEAADLDLDGDIDLIVEYDLLTVLVNNGDATFTTNGTYFAPTQADYAGDGDLTVGDFNGDGTIDIAVPTPSNYVPDLCVLLNRTGQ